MIASQPQLIQHALSPGDVVYTPDWCARDMVDWFKPSGRVLEPCKGDGAIYKYLPAGAEWCEIEQGRDFFAWHEPVDWIISNPPYRIIKEWLEHSFRVAENIVYLMPLNSPFNSMERMRIIFAWGGIKAIRPYGNGSMFGMNYGFACGAFHFVRDYTGPTSWSWYA